MGPEGALQLVLHGRPLKPRAALAAGAVDHLVDDRDGLAQAAREAIADFGGAELVDEPAEAAYPMPLDYSETVACGVGRIRLDRVLDNGLSLWVCGDQLWKGAALNAIQIAELLHERGRLGQ